MQITSAMFDNHLVDSLLAFDNTIGNQEIMDYLAEHLYIQSYLAMPRHQQLGNIQGKTKFYRACQKLYCADDESMKNQALNEIRQQRILR